MKKRIISLVLTIVLVCSLAVAVSAREVVYGGRYNGYFYTASTYLETQKCGGTLECEGCPSTIRVDLEIIGKLGTTYAVSGTPSVDVATNNRIVPEGIKKVTANYCFYNVVEHTEVMLDT